MVVLATHAGLVAWLLRNSDGTAAAPRSEPVELLYLPPPQRPRIVAQVSRPKRLTLDTEQSIVPPVLHSILPSPLPAASSSDGDGPGVDWKAEARRAVQAYEIRAREPPDYAGLAGSPAEEHWWPPGQRRSGTPFKTRTGDWIVWINDNCYQVATSAAHTFALGALLPPIVCTPDATNSGSATR
jgi:hypothetical protein